MAYAIDNPNRTAWQWTKQYKVLGGNTAENRARLKAYIEDTTSKGLAGWLNQVDHVIKAEFWLSSFTQKGQTVPILTLVILLISDGDPWEGDPAPNPVFPPIPQIEVFFEPQEPDPDGKVHYSFEMEKLSLL